MQGMEIQLQSMGLNATRHPTGAETRHARAYERRQSEMRARVRAAERARQEREAWETRRTPRSRGTVLGSPTAGASVKAAVVAGLAASFLLVFVVPQFL